MSNKLAKQFYHLVAGKVLFRDPETDQMGAFESNTMITTHRPFVQVQHLGKAQQSLQLLMFQKLNDPKLEVVNVIIMSISNLGQMTDLEFNEAPKGTKLEELAGRAQVN